MRFDVNTDAVVRHTAKLERLSKTALPKAVRETLSKLALDVKKNTMPASAEKSFTVRQKNFFKGNSTVDFARGNNINSMKSQVGFAYLKKGGNNKAVDELEQQEHGGEIEDRSLLPADGSRISKNKNKMVSKRNRLKGLNIVKVSSIKGNNEKQRFFKGVLKVGVGGYLQTRLSVVRVKSIRKLKKGFKFNLETVYLLNNSSSIKVDSTNFMKNATEKTALKADSFFIKEAQIRFERHFI